MPKGISEADVHQAADALVAQGERPTVERIRAHLGTGSPNTIGRWLESWWKVLASRLTQNRVRQDLPSIPEPVASLAAHGWEMAVTEARAHAQGEMASERKNLDAASASIAERAALLEQRETEAQAEIEHARQAATLARQHLADLQRLSDQQASTIRDLTTQRDSALARIQRAEQQEIHLRQQMDDLVQQANQERGRHAEHQRAIENRAHAEVDRARQEAQRIRQQLELAQREHRNALQAVSQREEIARNALTEAQREAAVQRARADTLAKRPRAKEAPTKTRAIGSNAGKRATRKDS